MNAFFERVIYGLVVFTLIVLCVAIRIGSARAQSVWDNNPYNFKNSEYNYANNPYNHANTPYGWENNPYNMESTNMIYDNTGNQIAYKTRGNGGEVNIFDPSGNRIGYAK
jgi:cytochrome bd-type quinol oxidase subunit 1